MTEQATQINQLNSEFMSSMRRVASSVFLVTARDKEGCKHGMAVTSAVSLTMDPPAMMVAVNRCASIHPVISKSGAFALNLLGDDQGGMLEAFSRSDMRDKRFLNNQWTDGYAGLPALKGALATHFCRVMNSHNFGTHTVFFGQVEDLILSETSAQGPAPIVWLNGRQVAADKAELS